MTSDQIPVHKTETYPLPAMNIDESSTVGNAEVIDTIFKELDYGPDTHKIVKVVDGDQLSIARARAFTHNRLGHDNPRQSYLNLVSRPGLFHSQLHVIYADTQTHWGSPSLGSRDPGSLSFHNTVLDRKPIVLTSLPPYRTCRDLVFASLYARILHCLELVSGSTLSAYSQTATYDDPARHAEEILEKYASSQVVDKLRKERSAASTEAGKNGQAGNTVDPKGDMVFENAVLFMRDALLVREFTDAIKSGDSGRIILMLKTLALFYRGTGRSKYLCPRDASSHT